MSREDYIHGYLNGIIGNTAGWTKQDVELVLGRVLKEEAHAKWWDTPIPEWSRMTPNEMWQVHGGKTAVVDLVIDYLNPSFS